MPRISQLFKLFTWPQLMTLKIEVKVTYCDPMFIMGCVRDTGSFLFLELSISDVGNLKMTDICHLISTVDFEIQVQTYFQMTIQYLWLNTCYGLDFTIDFNIIEVEELKKFKTNIVAMVWLTLKRIQIWKKKWFDLKNHGQPTRSGTVIKNRIVWDPWHWECWNRHQDWCQ